MLFHLLKSFCIFNALEEICQLPPDQFSSECQLCTLHDTEFLPISFPTPTQLYLFIFSTVVG